MRLKQLVAHRLENAGLECLCGLRRLSSLNLAYTNITDPGIATLTDLQCLTYLSVDSRLITDYGLHYLRSLSNLVTLDVFGCKVLDMQSDSGSHVCVQEITLMGKLGLNRRWCCRCQGSVQFLLHSSKV